MPRGMADVPSLTARAGMSIDMARQVATRSHAVRMLQVFAVAALAIPSDSVLKPVGAEGNAAGLVGMFMFGTLLAATVFGLHNPLCHRHPIRAAILLFWISVLTSYVVMHRPELSGSQIAAADRMLMQLAVITGV